MVFTPLASLLITSKQVNGAKRSASRLQSITLNGAKLRSANYLVCLTLHFQPKFMVNEQIVSTVDSGVNKRMRLYHFRW